jgi:pimeloyl-ACP methyl ester carboxylesterase
MLRPPQAKSGILVGVGDYVLEDGVPEFPKDWPIPDSVPRPITRRVWAEEGARILEQGEIVPGHLASAALIAARVTGADPMVLAAVIRGAVVPTWPTEELRKIEVPVLILNGKADVANQKIDRLLQEIPMARSAECNGDHHSTPYQPTLHKAVVEFFEGQRRLRGH